MKVSNLLDYLTQALFSVGDVEVVILTDTPDGLFHLDYEPSADIIEVPINEYSSDKSKETEKVFAIGWNGLLSTEEESKPAKETKKPKKSKGKANLRSV